MLVYGVRAMLAVAVGLVPRVSCILLPLFLLRVCVVRVLALSAGFFERFSEPSAPIFKRVRTSCNCGDTYPEILCDLELRYASS